ncbi:MAG TPA: fumarylacetoacetate hydrolase family protein [Alphaproteobacteria bacterium]|nr:fumarylacetoacetate hydrolase family protein [Alphaproteobacteria bacterium]
MKLATLREGGRDGTLVVVARDLSRAIKVPTVARTLQAALDDWRSLHSELAAIYRLLNEDRIHDCGENCPFALDFTQLAAPLPRAYQWADGSAYLHHVELVRKARGAEMPPSFYDDPLMYQGGSDGFLGPCDDIPALDEAHGIDFEAEIAAIVDDVPMAATADEARGHIKLLMLVNDVSLRNLVPAELAKGFGFFHAKPASSFSPVAATPDELGSGWDGGKVNLPLESRLNGELFGRPNAGVDMNFDLPRLVAHAARTRALCAGTIIGSGTVSNRDPACGSSCIAERRTIETIETGRPTTPFMKFGDRIRIEMMDAAGRSIFGAIDQKVVRYARTR